MRVFLTVILAAISGVLWVAAVLGAIGMFLWWFPTSWEMPLLLYGGSLAAAATLCFLVAAGIAGPGPGTRAVAGLTICGLESIGCLLLGMIAREFLSNMQAGPNMAVVGCLAYASIGTGLLAALVAGAAGLEGWKSMLLGCHATALTGAGTLLGIWAFIAWLGGTSLVTAGMMLAGGVASFIVGNILTPYELLQQEQDSAASPGTSTAESVKTSSLPDDPADPTLGSSVKGTTRS